LRRFAAILASLFVVTAAIATDADARRVTALVVTGPQPPAVRAGAALGLYVAGTGLDVSRQEALERLEIDEFVGRTCGTLQRCPIEVFVSVPQLGSQPNKRRFDVTIRGGGWRGVLVSDRTRIPGLVAIEDIRETVRALERDEEPPIRVRASANPASDLASLDERLDDARRAQGPATWVLALVMIVLTTLALVTREAVLARGAIAFPVAALLFAVIVAALEATGPFSTTLAVFAAAPLALAVARLRGEAFALVLAGGVALYGLVLAAAPEANSLSAIGPHPWSGGRFHGVTNQIETLLLPAGLAAGATLGGWRLAAVAALAIVVIGTSETGADGGGLFVYAGAFTFLSLRVRGRRPSPASAVAVLAVVALVVALDAATGGSSHVVDTVRDGPDALWEAFERRLSRSWSIVTSSIFQAAVFVFGLAVLAWLGTLRPRSAVVDAYLLGIAISLFANDSPTKVVGFGAVACAALRAWSVSSADEPGIESRR
jgi:hypothetical protein